MNTTENTKATVPTYEEKIEMIRAEAVRRNAWVRPTFTVVTYNEYTGAYITSVPGVHNSNQDDTLVLTTSTPEEGVNTMFRYLGLDR